MAPSHCLRREANRLSQQSNFTANKRQCFHLNYMVIRILTSLSLIRILTSPKCASYHLAHTHTNHHQLLVLSALHTKTSLYQGEKSESQKSLLSSDSVTDQHAQTTPIFIVNKKTMWQIYVSGSLHAAKKKKMTQCSSAARSGEVAFGCNSYLSLSLLFFSEIDEPNTQTPVLK